MALEEIDVPSTVLKVGYPCVLKEVAMSLVAITPLAFDRAAVVKLVLLLVLS